MHLRTAPLICFNPGSSCSARHRSCQKIPESRMVSGSSNVRERIACLVRKRVAAGLGGGAARVVMSKSQSAEPSTAVPEDSAAELSSSGEKRKAEAEAHTAMAKRRPMLEVEVIPPAKELRCFQLEELWQFANYSAFQRSGTAQLQRAAGVIQQTFAVGSRRFCYGPCVGAFQTCSWPPTLRQWQLAQRSREFSQ